MLRHLTIENLALVDRIEIDFGPGLNVLTGETGAGKSVLVGALSLVLGARASSEVIRSGEKEAVVEALFDLDDAFALRLEEIGIDVADGELIVRRVVSQGKSRVLLNGQMATVSMLAEVVKGALDITSQHEHVTLLDEERHLDVIDAFGDLFALRDRVERAHTEVVGYRTALSNLATDEIEKVRREDYLRFAVDEIAAVDPKPGELESLEQELSRLKNVTELSDGVRRAEGSLYSDDGAVIEVLGRIERDLIKLSALDERLAPLAGSIGSTLAEMEELSRELGRYAGALASDPERLAELDDRLEQIRKLVRKYGGSVEAVLKARAEMEQELDELVHEEARQADLLAALEAQVALRRELALELTASRNRVVRALEKAIQAELAELSMKNTRVAVELRPLDEPGARGAESARLMISPNVGEPLRPLEKTASGGELSRVLLAIKHVLAHRAAVSTYVFDEIDTGIGGAVAEVLGTKLKAVAETAQIVCVTHLAPIAAYADVHLVVRKKEREGRTVTEVSTLDERARVEEIARMLGGVQITDKTRSLAAELRDRGVDGSGLPPNKKRVRQGTRRV
jgi:DNA repair protein RecN (Recombination protein N)